MHDMFQVFGFLRSLIATDISAHIKIFTHCHTRKNSSTFGCLTNSTFYAVVRSHLRDVFTFKKYRAFCNGTYPRDSAQCCCLTGAIGANQCHYFTLVQSEGHALNCFNSSIEHMQISDLKQRHQGLLNMQQ